jgi:hypothetical protein
MAMYSGKSTGTTTVPNDNTVPQNTEGDQYMTQAITPVSAANILKIVIDNALFSTTTAGGFGISVFQDSTASALFCHLNQNQIASNATAYRMDCYMTAGTTSSTTFNVRAGLSATNTTTFGGVANTDFYGGKIVATLTIEEYQG